MRRALLLLVLVACKGKSAAPGAGSGSAASIDWSACETALAKAAAAPLDERPALVIDGCPVCGDWMPLLDWNRPPTEGGPPRIAIEAAIAGCHAFCEPTAKQRFLGSLDAARGTETRTPWRFLGEVCKDAVSAVPDNRFMSAPYFALDRIARAAAARGGDAAKLAGALELPLPAVSVTGTGVALPSLADGAQPTAGALAITLLGSDVYVGTLPRADLGATGITVTGNYPGDKIALADLAAALGPRVTGGATITLLAPRAMPAQALVPVIAAAAPVAPVSLAVTATGAPPGWDLPATLPASLEPGADVTVSADMTVQQLATEVAKRHSPRVGIRARP